MLWYETLEFCAIIFFTAAYVGMQLLLFVAFCMEYENHDCVLLSVTIAVCYRMSALWTSESSEKLLRWSWVFWDECTVIGNIFVLMQTLKRQSQLAHYFFNTIVAHGDLRNNRLNQLSVNLWNLAQKHGFADTKTMVREGDTECRQALVLCIFFHFLFGER